MKTDGIRLGINDYAFFWSFPEIVARERGFYREEGIDLQIDDITPRKKVDKSGLYTSLLDRGEISLYHAAEWVCISRVAKGGKGKIVAKSPAKPDNLNSSFTILTNPKAGIETPRDLAGVEIAVEKGTGSQYLTIQDLERHLNRDEISLQEVGGPLDRLVSLAEGRVEAASLMGPFVDLGRALGMNIVLPTQRENPTLLVASDEMADESVKRFVRATNKAIDEEITRNPREQKPIYLDWVKQIVDRLPREVRARAKDWREEIRVPRFSPWTSYDASEGEGTIDWMVQHELLPRRPMLEKFVRRIDLD